MMNASLSVVQVASGLLAAEDSPSLKPGLDANQVSPGVVGFLLTLLLAVLIIFVGIDHTRRQRRLQNRFDYAMAREAEEREAAEAQRRAEEPEAEPSDEPSSVETGADAGPTGQEPGGPRHR